MTRTILRTVVVGLATGCVTGVNHVLVGVKGAVVVRSNGGVRTDCVLELRRASDDAIVRQHHIGADKDFKQQYGLAPGAYYFNVNCGPKAEFKSQVYKFEGARYMKNPVDLGVIELP